MSLFETFKKVYDNIFETNSVNTDNLVFKLHYRVTVTALVIFSVVLSLGQVSHFKRKMFLPQMFSSTILIFSTFERFYIPPNPWHFQTSRLKVPKLKLL